jgi:hypothetical protein
VSVRPPIPDRASKAARRAGTQIERGVEALASELRAAREGLPVGPNGVQNFRKWLGWASYRFAAWVNPEIDEPW